MARKYQLKRGDKAALAQPTVNNEQLVYAALFKVSSKGQIKQDNPLAPFLLNPDTIEDSKSGNWVENSIPGQSDPILQWTSGGPRNLNFTALITKDTIHFPEAQTDLADSVIDSVTTAIGGIASEFAGINIPPLGDVVSSLLGTNTPSVGEDISIAPYLDYYRSLMYPGIDQDQVLQSSPPLIVLAMGKTLSSFTGKGVTGNIGPDTDLWVAKNISIRVTKWLPNLAPMEAEVTFNLVQYSINSRSSSSYDIKDVVGPPQFGSPSGFSGGGFTF